MDYFKLRKELWLGQAVGNDLFYSIFYGVPNI